MISRRQKLLGFSAFLVLSLGTLSIGFAAPRLEQRPDLADAVAGSYNGSITSDARGSSHPDVRISVTRIGPNLVRVSSEYPRIPTVEIPLQAAMSAILAARGKSVFLVDRAKSPNRLDLTIDDASWIGYR